MAFGSETNDPEDAVPAIVKYAINDWNQLDQLDPDKVTKHPWYQLNLDALKICVDKMSGEVGTNISFPGPFTSASDIISIGTLLRGMVKHPDKVHQLMSIVTESLKIAAKPFVDNVGGIFLCDPIASGNVISPANYREFVKPYTTDLWNYIHSIGGSGGYHICGDTNAITVDMVETGCDIPLNGPLENIDAFMSAVRTCAKYPLNPSNFAE